MVSSNFNIPEELYFSSKLVADLAGVDSSDYNFYKKMMGINKSINQMANLIEMGDIDFSDMKKSISSILRQCMMRASFLFMSDEDIAEVNYGFHSFIENDDYLLEHKNDKIAEQLVISCFKSVKRDRNKPSIVSLCYRK